MCKRVDTIKEYYAHLPYSDSDDNEARVALTKLSNSFMNERIHVDDSFSNKFFKAASIIKKNLSLFQSICEHVDTVIAIIEYLNHFGVKFMLGNLSDLEIENEIISVMYTLFNICTKYEVQSFLRNAIVKGTKLDASYDMIYSTQTSNEMILLQDSDLHAVISCFLAMPVNYPLSKIFVQQPIKQKFVSLIRRYCQRFESLVRTFRSKQELLISSISNKINVTSIWSEDIVAAKSLAVLLNRDILFINTHADFCGGIVILPCVRLSHACFKLNQSQIKNLVNTARSDAHQGSIYNFFYDGMWQEPVKDTYWSQNGDLWANATSDDIKRCINSAEKGAKIWSVESINSRMQILSKFASILACNGKFSLAERVSKWIEFPYLCENSLLCPQTGRLEVTLTRRPYGIVILEADQETVLFCRLIQALITGNSVIVICSATSCTLAPYCDMFSTTGIPSGVINMLLRENTKDILDESYRNYEAQLFAGDKPEKIYINLTMPKKIVLPVK